jgi:hypothetical protein
MGEVLFLNFPNVLGAKPLAWREKALNEYKKETGATLSPK